MNDVNIVAVTGSERKAEIAQKILQELPDWFGLPENTQNYINLCKTLPVWAAIRENEPVGFVSLKPTSKLAAEVHCMGILPPLHRQGIGKALMEALEQHARAAGYRLLQVKTVDAGHYPEYDRTIAFYEGVGFVRLEVFPTLWDEWNPCLVLVKALH